MLEIFFVFVSFVVGRKMGMYQALNKDITTQTAYMQSLIDESYEARDNARKMLVKSEEELETWKRRYWNLIEEELEE